MSEPPTVLVSAKIGPVHLGRDAYVYVRQSTLTQLREHTESLLRHTSCANARSPWGGIGIRCG